MEASPLELYPVIAQIAAAFAGFGSLASGLGQKRGGDDARMDAYRLESMLLASLSATMFGLLPATLAALGGDLLWGIRLSALFAAASILLFSTRAMIRARRLTRVAGFSIQATIVNLVCVWGAFVAFSVCAAGSPDGRDAAYYLLGLMGFMGSTVTLFSRVIVSMLQPYQRDLDAPAAPPAESAATEPPARA